MPNTLVLTVSSRALFDLDESNTIFETEGAAEYARYQIANANKVFEPGIAFKLVKKLLELNKEEEAVEIILLSRNSLDTGLRIFNSIREYFGDDDDNAPITRAAFTSGQNPYHYAKAFGSHLFLSAHIQDVKDALSAGCAAASLMPNKKAEPDDNALEHHTLRIAFDGNAMPFSEELEQTSQTHNVTLPAHKNHHNTNQKSLSGGQFKGFLSALQRIQTNFSNQDDCPIQTVLITERPASVHDRAIKVLRSWDIRIDEALFLNGLEKVHFLQAFDADIFFDDQRMYLQDTDDQEGTVTAQLPEDSNKSVNAVK